MRPHELQNARKSLKMTQRQLGEAIGLDGATPDRTIRNYEAGRNPIPGLVAAGVAALVEVRGLRKEVERLKKRTPFKIGK